MSLTESQVEEVFFAALEKPAPAERATYLDGACHGNPALRQRVEQLLRAHPQVEKFLRVGPLAEFSELDSAHEQSVSERPGSVVGPYKLLEQIGEGGFGVVFMAEQMQPVRRKVALKVLKPGMDTRQVIARFEAERQALAVMDHPNIAKVLEAGETASGRPYFVMELVRGIPITEFCDQVRMPMQQRLELLFAVCRAVQHAHQKGIIHRDLKPTNVLVTLQDGAPIVKVIDFGIAKATGQQLTDKTLFTGFGQMIGTPLYMSPEQAALSAVDVDTRSDVYSLGVLLYELLTGSTPFDKETLSRAGYDEMRRMIREDEPPRPSVRLSALSRSGEPSRTNGDSRATRRAASASTLATLAACRQTEPAKLTRQVRGDLDWIVMKALEKDRNRRYDTANALALDLQRYLAGEPVEACPPSAIYRFRKFATRKKATLTTICLVAVALLLGTAASAWQAVLATRAARDAVLARAEESWQRHQAEQQRSRAVDAEKLARGNEQAALQEEAKAKQSEADLQAFSDFLVLDVLAVARPEGVQGGLGVDVTVAQALAAAETVLAERFVGRPLAEATARDAIGKTWRNLTKFEAAERNLRRAVALREQQLGPDHDATLNSRNSLAVLLNQMGGHAEAIALHEDVLQRRMATLGSGHLDTFNSMANLAVAYLAAGQIGKALSVEKRLHQEWTEAFGRDRPHTVRDVQTLAEIYQAAGKRDQALPLFERALAQAQATLGPGHPVTLDAMKSLATAYKDAGQVGRALPLLEQSWQLRRAKLGPQHADTLTSLNNLALAHLDAGHVDQAVPLLQETLRLQQATLGPDHPNTFGSMNNLAFAYQSAGKFDEALQQHLLTRERAAAKLGPAHPNTLISVDNLARSYKAVGQLDKALPLFEENLKQRQAVLGPDHPYTLQSMHNLAVAYLADNKLDQALPLMERTLAQQQARLGPDHPDTLAGTDSLGMVYLASGRSNDASLLLEQAWSKRQAKLGPQHPDTIRSMNNLADCYGKLGQPEKAEPILRECLAIREKIEANVWTTFNSKSRLGGCLLAQKNYPEAEPLLLAGYEGMKEREDTIPLAGRVRLAEAVERLVQLYEVWDQPAKADEWRRKMPAPTSAQPAKNDK